MTVAAGDPGRSLPDIRHTLVLAAPVDRVWNAVATAQGMSAWLMPNDLQPGLGSTFHLQTPFGPVPCRITAFDPPYRLAFTWGSDWHVTITLEPAGSATRLTLVHSGWKAGHVAPESGEPHEVIRERMDRGWATGVLPRLRALVES